MQVAGLRVAVRNRRWVHVLCAVVWFGVHCCWVGDVYSRCGRASFVGAALYFMCSGGKGCGALGSV
jgi:hypothetical protein